MKDNIRLQPDGSILASTRDGQTFVLTEETRLDEITMPNAILIALHDRTVVGEEEIEMLEPIFRVVPVPDPHSRGQIQVSLTSVPAAKARMRRDKVILHLEDTLYDINTIVKAGNAQVPVSKPTSTCGGCK